MTDKTKEGKLIPPYGGKLVNLIVDEEERQELLERSNRLPSILISAGAPLSTSSYSLSKAGSLLN